MTPVLIGGVEYDTIQHEQQGHRPISWIKAARKDFEAFPQGARTKILRALTIAAEGRKADIAKPMKGFESGIFEVALRYRTDAYRTVYALRFAGAVWCYTPARRRPSRVVKHRRGISI